jgi:hypothetical protein
VLGAEADQIYATVYKQQMLTSEPILAERGSRVLAARRILRDDDAGIARIAAATTEAARRARAGLPRTVAEAPPLDAMKGPSDAV